MLLVLVLGRVLMIQRELVELGSLTMLGVLMVMGLVPALPPAMVLVLGRVLLLLLLGHTSQRDCCCGPAQSAWGSTGVLVPGQGQGVYNKHVAGCCRQQATMLLLLSCCCCPAVLPVAAGFCPAAWANQPAVSLCTLSMISVHEVWR
jgi:hypothetical protein